MIFSQRMYDFWNMLNNWARIARIRLWKYRKKRMEEKARKDRRKARMQRPMLQKVQSEEQAFQPSSYSDLEAQAIVEELAKRFEDTSQDETLKSPVEEKPKPKIKPMVLMIRMRLWVSPILSIMKTLKSLVRLRHVR